MHQEGETQVLVTEIRLKVSNPSVSVPIEAGARGELIAINSVAYTPPDLGEDIHTILMTALSTNPEHEENPPASILEFMESKALYAKYVIVQRGLVNGINHAWMMSIQTHVHELYGLLRPRRQIWVLYAVNMTAAEIWYGLELNYRPVKVDDVTLSEYNHRYGLYKRT